MFSARITAVTAQKLEEVHIANHINICNRRSRDWATFIFRCQLL